MEQSTTAALGIVTLCCPRDLTAEAEEWLTSGLITALPSLRMRELFATRLDMFREAHLITVALDGDIIVGALSSRWAQLPAGPQFLHVTTQFVAEAHRSGPVFRQSWRSHFAEMLGQGIEFPGLIALKTYNPIVYCAMRAFTGAPDTSLYPAIGSAPRSEITATAAEVAATVSPGRRFDRPTGRIRSAGSPADLYPAMPLSRDPAVNDFFAAALQPGDRILCVLSIPTVAGAGAILQALGVTR